MKRLGVIELVPDTSGFLGKHDISENQLLSFIRTTLNSTYFFSLQRRSYIIAIRQEKADAVELFLARVTGFPCFQSV